MNNLKELKRLLESDIYLFTRDKIATFKEQTGLEVSSASLTIVECTGVADKERAYELVNVEVGVDL